MGLVPQRQQRASDKFAGNGLAGVTAFGLNDDAGIVSFALG